MPGAPGKPGALDAGVLNYIDLALSGAYADLQDFYRRGLAPEWDLVEELSGPVLNFRRGNASVSVNLDNVSFVGTYELAVDQDYYGKLGR